MLQNKTADPPSPKQATCGFISPIAPELCCHLSWGDVYGRDCLQLELQGMKQTDNGTFFWSLFFCCGIFLFFLYELHDRRAVISFLYFSTNNRLVSHCLLGALARCSHEHLLVFGVFQINNVVIHKDKKQKHLPGTAERAAAQLLNVLWNQRQRWIMAFAIWITEHAGQDFVFSKRHNTALGSANTTIQRRQKCNAN